MAIKITRDSVPGDRYWYDFKVCPAERGWAQVDTSQDASYYGMWINPGKLKLFEFCEGDITSWQCDTAPELVQLMAETRDSLTRNGHRFKGIDPGFNLQLESQLVSAGLTDYFWPGHEFGAELSWTAVRS